MGAKERKDAVSITREILMNALDSPVTIAVMVEKFTDPDQVEAQVDVILEYLDRTEEKTEAAEGEIKLKRLTGKMKFLMYTESGYDPADRDKIIGFVEKAWRQVEDEE